MKFKVLHEKVVGKNLPSLCSYSFFISGADIDKYKTDMISEDGVKIKASPKTRANTGRYGAHFCLESGNELKHSQRHREDRWKYTILFDTDAIYDSRFGLDVLSDKITLRVRDNTNDVGLTASRIHIDSIKKEGGVSVVTFWEDKTNPVPMPGSVFDTFKKIIDGLQSLDSVAEYKDWDYQSESVNKLPSALKRYSSDNSSVKFSGKFPLTVAHFKTGESLLCQVAVDNNICSKEEIAQLYKDLSDKDNPDNFLFNEPELLICNPARKQNPIINDDTCVFIGKEYIKDFVMDTACSESEKQIFDELKQYMADNGYDINCEQKPELIELSSKLYEIYKPFVHRRAHIETYMAMIVNNGNRVPVDFEEPNIIRQLYIPGNDRKDPIFEEFYRAFNDSARLNDIDVMFVLGLIHKRMNLGPRKFTKLYERCMRWCNKNRYKYFAHCRQALHVVLDIIDKFSE